MKDIKLSDLHPHPKNPRLAPREDVVEQIAAQITAAGEFDPAHALIVRKNASGYEIISGHHRHLAAQKAGLASVPCWVREMSDEDAYMALALNNAQGELHPLERGWHALGFVEPGKHGKSVKAYAEQVGRDKEVRSVQREINAAEVMEQIGASANFVEHWSPLAEIHSAPEWLWPALVSRLVSEDWTVEQARKAAQRVKDIETPPAWVDTAALAEAMVSGHFRPQDVTRFATRVEQAEAALKRGEDDADRLVADLHATLDKKRPSKLSDVDAICITLEEEQAALIKQRKQADMLRTQREEEIAARNARYRRVISLEEWNDLAQDERSDIMAFEDARATFLKQTNKSIEWAQWSWNPVTGCLHECPYCYARDLAHNMQLGTGGFAKTEAYQHGFAPAFHPTTVLAPRSMKPPAESKKDTRFRNVFVCSMADLFGRWVPAEWVDRVFSEIRNGPQWNFLCLTKFPKRMAEFDIPENAWMGTTVDRQERVNNAEAAFAKVKSGVRWLSVEPMLTPLKFKHLDRFNWIVIGGSSKSTQTPEWFPPIEWVIDLVNQARAAGCKVYMKDNVGVKDKCQRILEMPFDAPMPEEEPLPAVFDYLRNNTTKEK